MGVEANPRQAHTVRRAEKRDVPALRELLRLYFAEGDVRFKDTERTVLSQVQAPSLGFYVAEISEELAGCVLCRALVSDADAAECKRLYVRPEFRGHGVATGLMDVIEAEARAAGFAWMYLDSKDNFVDAMAMYRRHGYVECPRYNDNPQATFFFRKRLG